MAKPETAELTESEDSIVVISGKKYVRIKGKKPANEDLENSCCVAIQTLSEHPSGSVVVIRHGELKNSCTAGNQQVTSSLRSLGLDQLPEDSVIAVNGELKAGAAMNLRVKRPKVIIAKIEENVVRIFDDYPDLIILTPANA